MLTPTRAALLALACTTGCSENSSTPVARENVAGHRGKHEQPLLQLFTLPRPATIESAETTRAIKELLHKNGYFFRGTVEGGHASLDWIPGYYTATYTARKGDPRDSTRIVLTSDCRSAFSSGGRSPDPDAANRESARQKFLNILKLIDAVRTGEPGGASVAAAK